MKSATKMLKGKVATNDCNEIENLHAGRAIILVLICILKVFISRLNGALL